MKPYILHREGRVHVAVTTVLMLAMLSLGYVLNQNGLPFWGFVAVLTGLVFWALVLNFFRNPHRVVTLNDSLVLAPCDGKVVVIEEVVDKEYFGDKRIQVSIFMSPLNVHVNRNPMSGTVKFFRYFPGKFLVAWHPKSSTENERTLTVVERNGLQVGYKQIAGGVARRIRWYIQEGDAVTQGQEFGFIKFGSRMDLLLPPDTKVLVELNQTVRGGETPIAQVEVGS